MERIGLDLPVVQAALGAGVADGELAGAVSAAGALGTVESWLRERSPEPFVRRAGGLAPRLAGRLRAAGIPVLVTVGTADDARLALAGAGETVHRIREVVPAAEAVAGLAP